MTLLAVPAGPAGSAISTDPGEAIFRQGVLPSGAPLEAMRDGGLRMDGAAAACVNCHRRSGLGSKSGLTNIPPITGRYLFHPSAKSAEDLDIPYVETMRSDHEPYTDATLARAIRDGIDAQGRPLNYLMPHFALDDSEMAALIAYLKRLDPRRAPGVGDGVLHFATIITPDADPVKRQGMLDVLEHYVAEKNAFPFGATPPLRSSRKMMYMVNRQWQLHVWDLRGPPETWGTQLEQHMAAEPVFAVISGLGGKNWAPVSAFCERAAVPCLFPNVEVPETGHDDFYALYFSRGVLLEAGLFATEIGDAVRNHALKAVRQVYRSGDNGEAGARALARRLQERGIDVTSRALAPGESLAKALGGMRRDDALVLWLRPADLAALGKTVPPHTVFISGLMGGLERAPLPASWRDVTHIAYPFDLPERRRVRVDYALGWFAIRHIPIVDEQVQADTFLACGLLAETLGHMADTFVRDHLVEIFEDMVERRVITGYYPRLSLAPGQRFASKGGYMVHFSEASGTRIAADGDWIVP
ncbi:MAG: c-type cytochrome [Ralstonia sp.]|uniref:c-type cytochrome n=1 Tax=Ralstonia sp. TaxID=54061 RepID=UPI00397C77D2